ncbi:hypothetical protein [Halorubrum sp. AJ67]|uniref:hypothetical protein n=1 Tax=Halorubrum sp. AJ67 TaxID=1173487 RepID=UPI0003DDA38F|nr:hypothetical protein [Halorubrum sp. AJ67]CDK38248.1 hypothetical protein BN903_448 [Halorubrum sp. AJ67]
MTTHNSNDTDERSTVLSQVGLPNSVALPEGSVGIFTFSREELNLPSGDRQYQLKGILTTEGWIPPAPRTIAHLLGQAGDSPQDMAALGEYTAGRGSRLVIEPQKLDEQLSEQGSVTIDDNVGSLFGSPFQDTAEYYLPDGLSQEQTVVYLQNAVTAVREYAKSQITENPTSDELAELLAEQYGVAHEVALEAVEQNDNSES